MTEQSPDARRLIGNVLIVLGVMWMVLSGLCTLGGLSITVSLAASQPSAWALPFFLAIIPGAISIGIGWLVYRGGMSMRRKNTPETPNEG
jgi:hypothetical protein